MMLGRARALQSYLRLCVFLVLSPIMEISTGAATEVAVLEVFLSAMLIDLPLSGSTFWPFYFPWSFLVEYVFRFSRSVLRFMAAAIYNGFYHLRSPALLLDYVRSGDRWPGQLLIRSVSSSLCPWRRVYGLEIMK